MELLSWAGTAKNCTKKRDARAELLFCSLTLLFFLRSPCRRLRSVVIGSFSIDDGDGGEKVTFKMNSPLFKLCRAHSNTLKMSNVGEFPWS